MDIVKNASTTSTIHAYSCTEGMKRAASNRNKRTMYILLLFLVPTLTTLALQPEILNIPSGHYDARISSLPPGSSLVGHLEPRERTTLLEIIREPQDIVNAGGIGSGGGSSGLVMLTAKKDSIPDAGHGGRFRGAVRFQSDVYRGDNGFTDGGMGGEEVVVVGNENEGSWMEGEGASRLLDVSNSKRWLKTRSRTELLGKPGVWVDIDGYFAGGDYSYLVLPPSDDGGWYFRVKNDNGNRGERFAGIVRVTEYEESHGSPCPIGLAENGRLDPCSGRGTCENGKCVCEENRGGRLCQHDIIDLDAEGTKLSIPSEKIVYLKYTAPKGGAVAVVLKNLPCRGHSFGYQQAVMFAKQGRVSATLGFDEEIRLPSLTNIRYQIRLDRDVMWGFPQQTVTRSRHRMRRGETLYISIYNMHHSPFGKIGRHYPVDVSLQVYPCGGLGGRKCPTQVDYSSEMEWSAAAFLILPFCVVGFAITIMLMCITIWIRICRAHAFEIIHGYPMPPGLTSIPLSESRHIRGDRLSKSELEQMFPTFPYRKEEFDALGIAGDLSCSVCLSNYEQGERVRRLPCAHIYHDTCVSTWLVGSCATCPRCRRPARIETPCGGASPLRRAIRTLLSRLYLRLRQMVTMNELRLHRDYEAPG